MKKIITLLFLLPLIVSAQQPVENKSVQATDTPAEKTTNFSEASKKKAKETIEKYRRRVIKGESMSTLAALYSEDPGSTGTGGRYDGIKRGQFVPEFEAVAFSLMPGEISEVFETQYGFHFVQLIARRGEVIDVRHILVCPK